MTETELHDLVRLLQEKTPLGQLSNMQARTVFEFMLQRGYTINRKACCDFASTTETETAGDGITTTPKETKTK